MINYLAALRTVSSSRSGYNHDMREYLSQRDWDTVSLSDKGFEQQLHDYVENYRNEADHPNMMDEEVAMKCKEKTKRLSKSLYSVRSDRTGGIIVAGNIIIMLLIRTMMAIYLKQQRGIFLCE